MGHPWPSPVRFRWRSTARSPNWLGLRWCWRLPRSGCGTSVSPCFSGSARSPPRPSEVRHNKPVSRTVGNSARRNTCRRPAMSLSVLMTMGNNAPFGTGIRLQWRQEIARHIEAMPCAILDATADPEILKRWFPRLSVVADRRAIMGEGATVIQLNDTLFGFSALIPGKHSDNAHDEKQRIRAREQPGPCGAVYRVHECRVQG